VHRAGAAAGARLRVGREVNKGGRRTQGVKREDKGDFLRDRGQ
jgi:hypothetical protein